MTLAEENLNNNELEELDLEASSGYGTPSAPQAPETKSYNHQQHQESFRGWIAIALIVLLAIIVIYSLCFIYNLPKDHDNPEKSLTYLIQILQIVFGPLVTLVATAVGYYFGSNSNISKS